MLTIEMLPASEGDCLWIEYGSRNRVRRILIDGGVQGTYQGALRRKIMALPASERRFELLIVTHVDLDHIGGALALMQDATLDVSFGDVWFNGFKHLPGPIERGPNQGELLSERIEARKLPWNAAFRGGAVVIPGATLPVRKLPGGLRLTVLSPTPERLAKLRPVWEDVQRKAGLLPGGEAGPEEREEAPRAAPAALSGPGQDLKALAAQAFEPDRTEANGSSIAVLLEHAGKSCLLGGDAHPDVLKESIRKLIGRKRRLRVDAVKLPHHGSRRNVSDDLSKLLDCRDFLISTSGNRFHHPDAEAMARVILGGRSRVLHFNYRSQETETWNDPELIKKHGYEVRYPDEGAAGLVVRLA